MDGGKIDGEARCHCVRRAFYPAFMPPKKKTESKASVKPTRRAAAKAALLMDEGGAGGGGGSGAGMVATPRRVASLDEIVGHESVKRGLRAAMASGRVHHAWVFAGEAGVGKFTTALAFAGELLLPPAGDPERAHLEELVRTGGHPDLHVVTKELAAVSREDKVRSQKQTTIAKAVLDEFLIEPASKTRTVSARSIAHKVFIVDEAELIDAVGQNTMLKTLEEPAPGTSAESRLLPTIRSRCQRVALGALSDEEVLACLQRAGVSASPAERAWVLTFARGSPGAAVNAVQHGLFAWHSGLAPMLEAAAHGGGAKTAALGSTMARHVETRAKAAVEGQKNASKDAANRLWARRMLGFVAESFRAGVAAPATREASLRALDLCREAELQIESNVGYGVVLENLGAQLGG